MADVSNEVCTEVSTFPTSLREDFEIETMKDKIVKIQFRVHADWSDICEQVQTMRGERYDQSTVTLARSVSRDQPGHSLN